MSAHLKTEEVLAPEYYFSDLTAAHLDALMLVEQASYSHPWTRGNFLDCLRSGYRCQVLWQAGAAVPQIMGYTIALRGVEEAGALVRRERAVSDRRNELHVVIDQLRKEHVARLQRRYGDSAEGA